MPLRCGVNILRNTGHLSKKAEKFGGECLAHQGSPKTCVLLWDHALSIPSNTSKRWMGSRPLGASWSLFCQTPLCAEGWRLLEQRILTRCVMSENWIQSHRNHRFISSSLGAPGIDQLLLVGLPHIRGVTNRGLRGVWPPFLEIGLLRPFSSFFCLFRPFSAFSAFSKGYEEHVENPEKRRRKAFLVRYPGICLNHHLLKPHLRHPKLGKWHPKHRERTTGMAASEFKLCSVS